jgi:hypothetical protein
MLRLHPRWLLLPAAATAGANWEAAAHWIRRRVFSAPLAYAIWVCFVNATGRKRVIKGNLNSPELNAEQLILKTKLIYW